MYQINLTHWIIIQNSQCGKNPGLHLTSSEVFVVVSLRTRSSGWRHWLLGYRSHGYVDRTHHLHSQVSKQPRPQWHENTGNTFLWNNRNYWHNNLATHHNFHLFWEVPLQGRNCPSVGKTSIGNIETEKNFAWLCPMTELSLAALKQLGLLPELDSNTALWFRFPYSMFTGRQQKHQSDTMSYIFCPVSYRCVINP